MSADNEILIVRTGKTWRVAQTSASSEPYRYNDKLGRYEIVKDSFNFYFKNAPTFDNEKSAEEFAIRMEQKIEDQGGYVEYGISQYEWDEEFEFFDDPNE